MVLPIKIVGVEWHISIIVIVIWCAIVYFVLNNDLYGEFNPMAYWSELKTDAKALPGTDHPASEQDGIDEQGDTEPPTTR